MLRFSAKFFSAFGLLIGLFTLHSCQKEVDIPANPVAVNHSAGDRSPEHRTFGVTVYDGINPSLIVEIDEATGAVLNQFQAAVYTTSGNVPLVDLKGIARTSWGQFFITTGPGNTQLAYQNALMKVNVTNPLFGLGLCSYFNSNSNAGPISDLEFDPVSQNFYGLLNNTNQVVEISNFNNNYTTYSPAAAITGIDPGTILQGFSIVRDNVLGMYFVGCANRPGNGSVPTKLYTVPPLGGAAAFMTELAPFGDFAGGHCGIGFDLDLNHLAVNRTNIGLGTGLGLNELNPWNPLFPPVTGTAGWGANGFNFEDLSSSVY